MPDIFLSYRRQDSGSATGRLAEAIRRAINSQAFGVTRWRALLATAVWVLLLGGVLLVGGHVARQLAAESVPTAYRPGTSG